MSVLSDRARIAGLFLAAFSVSGTCHGDWPCFLGPDHNLHAPRGATLAQVKEFQPDWSIPVGEGFSGPVTAQGRVFLHDRTGDNETLKCLELANGKSVWEAKWLSGYQDNYGRGNGPRSTPCCFEDLVIVLGPQGKLQAFTQKEGKSKWTKDLVADYGSAASFFGVGASPMVIGGKLWINVGAAEAGVVGLDPATGKELHRIKGRKASYATPISWKVEQGDAVAMVTREGFLLLDTKDAKTLNQFPFRSRMEASVNAASPVKIGEGLFLTACYGTGGLALAGPKAGAASFWKNDHTLSSHFGTPVFHDGHLYGFHGRQEEGTELRCVDAKTGVVRWAVEGLGTGWALVVGKDLLVVGEDGSIQAAPLSMRGFEPFRQSRPLTAPVRAAPAWDEGRVLIRDAKALHAFKAQP